MAVSGVLVCAGCFVPALAADGPNAGAVETPAAGKTRVRPAQLAPPEGVIIERDVAYLAPGREEKLDLYLPANRPAQARSPAVVIIHGGGWTGGDKAAAREFNIGTTLAKAGYVCASVEYLKEGPDKWPTNLHDCKNGVRFLRHYAEKYQVDPGHIGVIGGSAGGHLALMVAYTAGHPELSPREPYPGVSDRVQACVDLYGITDLLTRQATDATGKPTGQLRNSTLFSDTREANPEKWKLASPVHHVTCQSPPTLILHGLADTTVDRDQSSELARVLAEHGVEHQLLLLPDAGHTFDLEKWGRKPLPQDLRPVVVGFFDKHLKPPR
jgi:acetyl esterase/lipase